MKHIFFYTMYPFQNKAKCKKFDKNKIVKNVLWVILYYFHEIIVLQKYILLNRRSIIKQLQFDLDALNKINKTM